ncbi:MAG: nuclear transport factor 2 family protein [Actinomycetota bacterium]|nr:nuclear transport factor 2 family protein [Actinomycetota bacterium]
MSAEEHLNVVKRGYSAFAAGDIEAAMEPFADDIEWIVSGNSAISGTYRGKEEIGGFFMKLAGKSFTTEPEHFLADDERVVVLTKTTADGQSSDQADVLTFREGKIVKFQSAGDTALEERIWGTR